MSAGYVVRGKHKGQHAAISDVDGTSPADRKPNPFGTINEAVTRVVWLGPFGWSDVAIYRVHPDGREERLPSYEEALGEIERLRTLHVTDRAEMAGAMVEMKEAERALDEAIECHARKDAEIDRLRGEIGEAHDAIFEAVPQVSAPLAAQIRSLVADLTATQGDPLAALEAAERRLLEAGGWREVEAGWQRPGDSTPECHFVAVTIERRQLAAKGGA